MGEFQCVPIGCGDGTVGPDEECDPAGPLENTCEAYGFEAARSGEVPCDDRCRLSTFLCGDPFTCGNGVIDDDEVCDGDDFGEDSCERRGLGPGPLNCFGCSFVSISSCGPPPTCGDGKVDPGEECDGSDLDGRSCANISFAARIGTLACGPDCRFDAAGCFEVCGPAATQSEARP